MKIYVGNLSYSATEDDLTELFSPFGNIVSAKIIKDNYTGESKGFAFIEMESQEEGENAIKELNGKELKNRALNVSVARPKEARPGGGGGGRDSRPRGGAGGGSGAGGFKGKRRF